MSKEITKDEALKFNPVNGHLIVEIVDELGLEIVYDDNGIAYTRNAAGIEIPLQTANISIHGAVLGKIISLCPTAFSCERYKYMFGAQRKIEVGDTVQFQRHAGIPIPGSKGKYQLIQDQNIQAVKEV